MSRPLTPAQAVARALMLDELNVAAPTGKRHVKILWHQRSRWEHDSLNAAAEHLLRG